MSAPRIIVALGGNALQSGSGPATAEAQLDVVRQTSEHIADISCMMKDKTVPRRKKALVIGGLIYLVLPFNLIPPLLFTVGWIDDLILWIWISWHLRDTLDKYWLGDTEDFSGKFKGKKVINNVEYEVKEDESTQHTKEEPRSKQ